MSRCADRCDESIAPLRDCLDVAGLFGRVTQRIAQAFDGCVQAVLEIDEGFGTPQPFAQVLAGNNNAGSLQEYLEQPTGLFAEGDDSAILPKLASLEVERELTEAHLRRRALDARHECPPDHSIASSEDSATPHSLYQLCRESFSESGPEPHPSFIAVFSGPTLRGAPRQVAGAGKDPPKKLWLAQQ